MFTPPELWIDEFGHAAGNWRVDQHLRVLADVNGDGLVDIVGFRDDGVLVSLSAESRFRDPVRWIADFGADHGWRLDRHPRFVTDVDGDGLADIVGFGDSGTYVARSTGESFSPAALWVASYGYHAGEWRTDRHIRALADVDGDGRPDVVGFGNFGVYVSRSTATGFSPPALWVEGYAYDLGDWRVDRHPRMLADVSGDGRADIVGFGNEGVYVSVSTGARFTPPELWIDAFGHFAGDWRSYRHLRTLADVDGDGRHDVVGFGEEGVFVSISQGESFRSPRLWLAEFGHANGWLLDRHPRLVADVDGDELPDIIGFADDSVLVSLATLGSFSWPQPWGTGYGHRDGWRTDKHLRLMGDVDGDGLADIVGFGEEGVYVSRAQL
ncbi:MAG TPA: VCBS repeat-containing protein [Nannocystis sp.]